MTRNEFEELLNYLRDELLCASECFSLYEALYNQRYIDVGPLNLAPRFFQIVDHSVLNCAALHLARLFDKNEDDLNLTQLKNQWELNYRKIGIDEGLAMIAVQEMAMLWNENSDAISKIKRLRNKALAHNDKNCLSGTIWSEVGVTVGDYRNLIASAHEVICHCYSILDLPVPTLRPNFQRDLDQIIYALKSTHEED